MCEEAVMSDAGFDATAWVARQLAWERRLRELEDTPVPAQSGADDESGRQSVKTGSRSQPRTVDVRAWTALA